MRVPSTRVDITAIMIQVQRAALSPAQYEGYRDQQCQCYQPSQPAAWLWSSGLFRKTAAETIHNKPEGESSAVPPLQLLPPPLAAPPLPLPWTRGSREIQTGNIILSDTVLISLSVQTVLQSLSTPDTWSDLTISLASLPSLEWTKTLTKYLALWKIWPRPSLESHLDRNRRSLWESVK